MAPRNINTVTAIAKANSLSKAVSLPRCAYVTFLAGNGDYVKGVVGLAKGLRKTKSKYPLVVAILPDVPEEHRKILVDQGCVVREIEPVYPPENSTQFAMAYYVINYSKLRIWEVFENIDHLFDMPDGYFYAVMDCFCEKTWSHTPQFKIGYCQQCPDKPLEYPQITPTTPFAEQDFLNMFFRDIYRPIPPIYNLVLAMLWRHPENIELEKAKVVHYCAAGSKPWRYTGEEQNMQREDIKMLIQNGVTFTMMSHLITRTTLQLLQVKKLQEMRLVKMVMQLSCSPSWCSF
ncbi:hypothetical protein LWI29_035290 [Acer saccharum]|uniref:Hexosyltransferase n=1 Tax=Acer saccharum TaxID=4024 RepID=A0AA39SZB3_ACESA|nr:hypothetical protein LWI29_035290 [Acer saccharum]